MVRHDEMRVVGAVSASAIGVILLACALSGVVSPIARPDPEPQRAASVPTAARAAAPAVARISPIVAAPSGPCSGGSGQVRLVACSVPACSAGPLMETVAASAPGSVW